MSRLLEKTFKMWPRLVVSVILVAGIAAWAGWFLPPTFQADASLWTDKPAVLDINNTDNSSSDNTPAQLQAAQLNQLLQTDKFLAAVNDEVKKINPASTLTSKDLSKFKVTGVMRNLVTIHVTATSAELARDEILGLFQAFRSRYLQNVQDQSSVTLDLYQKQLNENNTKQLELDKQVGEYLKSHPDIAANPASAALDPGFSTLDRQDKYYRDQIEGLQTKINQIQQLNELGIQGQDKFLRIEDPPVLPADKANSKVLTAVIFGLGGAVAGLALGLAYLVLLTLTDHSFFRTTELAALTGVPTYSTGYTRTISKIAEQLPLAQTKAATLLEPDNSGRTKMLKNRRNKVDEDKSETERELAGNKSGS